MSERGIPLASMEKLLKNAGAERVADGAKVALKEVLEEAADKIAKQAFEYAKHAGRKTVKSSDIKLAARNR
jgi:DNA-binding protein